MSRSLPELTLARQLELSARAAGPDVAVRFLDRHEQPTMLSYAEILQRALGVAGALQRLGLHRGDRVALILPTGPAFYDAFFGASLAALVPVPLYPPVRLGRLDEYHTRTAAMLGACQARVVITDGQIRRILGPTIATARPELGCITLDTLGRDALQGALPDRVDDLALIQFSSGTTREPKPIRLTHRQVLANAALILDQILTSYPEGPELTHRGVSWLPLYHDMGLVGCVMVALLHPGELTLIPPELFVARPVVWLRAISTYGGTISPAPNFAYSLCLNRISDEEMAGIDLSSWRLALNGAEPVTPGVLRRFAERFARHGLRPEALTPVYGLAEATLAVTFTPVTRPFTTCRFQRRLLGQGTAQEAGEPRGDDHDTETLVSLGHPLEGFELRVVDDAGRRQGEDVVGRILVRGPSVMQGYHSMPQATAAALVDGWLDTGDLGFLHRGELFLYGRAKDIIILAGRNHAPQQVEQALEGLEGLRSGCVAAVGVVPPGGDAEELVLLVERDRHSRLPAKAITRSARDRVAERTGLIASRVLLLEPGTLPRTSSGKIRRAEARRLLVADALRPPRPVTALRLVGQMLRSSLAFARARWG